MNPTLIKPTLRLGLLALLASGVVRGETVREVPTTNGSGIAIRLSTPLTYAPHFGFVPVRVAVENHSARDGVWTVNVTSGETSSFPGRASTGAKIAVPAAATQESWIYAPMAVPGIVAALVLDPNVPPRADADLPGEPPAARVVDSTDQQRRGRRRPGGRRHCAARADQAARHPVGRERVGHEPERRRHL